MTNDDVIQRLYERRQRAINGLYNCIPLPFPRFSGYLPGFERGRYVLITANQKVGKSKLCDFMLVYKPICDIVEGLSHLHLSIQYFSMEMSEEAKRLDWFCFLLHHIDGLRVPAKELQSTGVGQPVNEEYLKLLQSDRYKPYLDKFDEIVEFQFETKRPTAILAHQREFLEARGHWTYAEYQWLNPQTKQFETKTKKDQFIYDDPELYVINIFDNMGCLEVESGLDQRNTINRFSKYQIDIRDRYRALIVAIQHQNAESEGNEAFKLNRMEPSSNYLGDSKAVSRDASLILGLFSPAKYKVENYEGYNIRDFNDRIRFMNVIEDRDYGSNGCICPLYFDGAVSYFEELPSPADPRMAMYVDMAREANAPQRTIQMLHLSKQKRKNNVLKTIITKAKRRGV